jgi:hypothetical protein
MTNAALAKLYTVPLHPDTGNPTTGKADLEEMYWRLEQAGAPDRVIELVLEMRSLDYNINTQIKNWEPKEDGRVHTSWGFKAPSGQLDSSQPNVLNLSKWTATGQRFRRIIEAPANHVFIEFDKARYHITTMGYCSESREYIRFGQLDSHSIFASHIMPKEWGKAITMDLPEGEILDRANWVKKRCKEVGQQTGLDLRQVAKVIVLANQLGQGPRNLYRKNRRHIESEKQAKYYQDYLSDLFPEVTNFKDDIREVANGFDYRSPNYHRLLKLKARFGGPKFLLLKEWGIIDYFFDVFSWRYNKGQHKWVKAWGTDSEKAVAFPVQGIAFGGLKYEIREMGARGYLDRYSFINSVHDSNVFLCPVRLSDNCLADVAGVMGKPCDRLVNGATGPEGLRIGLEATMGRNLQGKDYFGEGTNPDGMQEVKI